MKPPFILLLAHGDGARVIRLRLRRAVVYGTAGWMSAMVLLAGGYVLLQGLELAALRGRVDGQRQVIDAYQSRLATVRSDIASWKTSHRRMREALDPAAGAKATSGVGATPVAAVAPAAARPAPWTELDLLANAIAEEGPRLRELERVTSRTGQLIKGLPLRWPVQGSIKSAYGVRQSPWTLKREQHDGIDIGSSPGTPVQAPAPGRVASAATGRDYGRYVIVDHGKGVRSLYGHLQRVDVKAGDRVTKGQVIGLVGSSGRSTGPHLHYEVSVNGKRVDPRMFLWEPPPS
jgi:murein DD-endopeptidase MepM/ murein hydrolase activator NlpD